MTPPDISQDLCNKFVTFVENDLPVQDAAGKRNLPRDFILQLFKDYGVEGVMNFLDHTDVGQFTLDEYAVLKKVMPPSRPSGLSRRRFLHQATMTTAGLTAAGGFLSIPIAASKMVGEPDETTRKMEMGFVVGGAAAGVGGSVALEKLKSMENAPVGQEREAARQILGHVGLLLETAANILREAEKHGRAAQGRR